MYKKNIGVEVSINNLEWKTLLQRKADSELESFFTGKYPQYNDPLSFLLDAISYSTYNDVRYKNLVYDRLVETSYYVTNVAERRDLLEYADKLLIEDVVYIPIYFPVANVLVKPWVKGYGKNPFGRPRVSLMSVTMSERAKARNR
ncbi:hypothetical protein [Bartonella sp. DGB1]|uniref:hypothetical protein n=1 Tax=Bartonella sp. DGB1 TaxID=3239807 RepID=UPI003526A09A